MYQGDWLDELRWGAIASGLLLALALQLLMTFLLLRPLDLLSSWTAVALVEGCIGAGAFVAGWRAGRAAVINGIGVALGGATVSLAATTLHGSQSLTMLSVLFLYGTFVVMGALGGFAVRFAHTSDVR